MVENTLARSTARAVRGASGTVATLPPLRVTVRVRWPRSRPQVLDVGAGGLRYAQPVQRKQRGQRMIAWRAEPGSDE